MLDTAAHLTRHAAADTRDTGPIRPGARVRYQGSIAARRGETFRAYACHCHRCWDTGDLRYRLVEIHSGLGERFQEDTAYCVRRSSLIRL